MGFNYPSKEAPKAKTRVRISPGLPTTPSQGDVQTLELVMVEVKFYPTNQKQTVAGTTLLKVLLCGDFGFAGNTCLA